MKVCVGIPVVFGVYPEVYFSHLEAIAMLSRRAEIIVPRVMNVFPHDRARERLWKAAVELDADYMLFIDSDMHVPHDIFTKLYDAMVATEAQMTLGYCYRRGYPYTSTWTKIIDDKHFNVTSTEQTSYVRLITTGLACNLINVKWVEKNCKKPLFFCGQIDGQTHWEDGWFCKRIYDAGGSIFGVPAVRTGHCMSNILIDDFTAPYLRDMWVKSGGSTDVEDPKGNKNADVGNQHQSNRITAETVVQVHANPEKIGSDEARK